MIKLQDFARSQGVTDRAIQKHLKTYAAELDGLFQRKGPNGTWLTEEACEILRSKMKQAPTAVFEPDPRVGNLEKDLADAKAVIQSLLKQMEQKEASMALLVQQNNEYRLQEHSVKALEAELTDRIKTASQEASEAARKASDEYWVLEIEKVRKEAQAASVAAIKAREDELHLQHQKELQVEQNRTITFKEWWSRRKKGKKNENNEQSE